MSDSLLGLFIDCEMLFCFGVCFLADFTPTLVRCITICPELEPNGFCVGNLTSYLV
jgi:hypothetical protein